MKVLVNWKKKKEKKIQSRNCKNTLQDKKQKLFLKVNMYLSF